MEEGFSGGKKTLIGKKKKPQKKEIFREISPMKRKIFKSRKQITNHFKGERSLIFGFSVVLKGGIVFKNIVFSIFEEFLLE